MSDHIPLAIQLEIMKRLPVKSLIQFRSVSKTWRSLIDTSDFIINHYNGHHTHVQHLLVKYDDPLVRYNDDVDNGVDYEEKYVSIVDDHTFPEHKVSPFLPPLVKMLECSSIIGSSHGLLGLYSRIGNGFRVVIWNPSIRKAIAVVVPLHDIIEGIYGTAIGFGVCRVTNDPKIVKITFFNRHNTNDPLEVDVFTLSTGAWRRSCGNIPRKSLLFHPFTKTFIDGVFYWLATEQFTVDYDVKIMIISFDITSEELTEIPLPDSLPLEFMYKLGESLVVVGQNEHSVYEVWMMGGGVPKSFTKLFTFTSNNDATIKGFRKSGEPIIDVTKQGEDDRGQLAIYEPHSKRIDNLGIEGLHGSFYMCNYIDTLLLLDQLDGMVYNGI